MRNRLAALALLLALASTAAAQRARYDVLLEKEPALGEKIPITLTVTNTGPGRLKVKDLWMMKIEMRLEGRVHGERVEVLDYSYDGSRGMPVVHEPLETGGAIIYFAPTYVQKPDLVLATGRKGSMRFQDLHGLFHVSQGIAPGVYKLTVRLDGRTEIRKSFKVVADGERTFELLQQKLRSGVDSEMNWASHFLFKLDEQRALRIVRVMLESGSESERAWAGSVLHSRGYIKW